MAILYFWGSKRVAPTCTRPGIGPEGSVLRSSFRCVTSTPGYRRNLANAALSVIASTVNCNCPRAGLAWMAVDALEGPAIAEEEDSISCPGSLQCPSLAMGFNIASLRSLDKANISRSIAQVSAGIRTALGISTVAHIE